VEVLDVLNARSFTVLQLLNANEFKTAREQLASPERDGTNIGQGVRGRLIGIYRPWGESQGNLWISGCGHMRKSCHVSFRRLQLFASGPKPVATG
jgi:hypothetical protein